MEVIISEFLNTLEVTIWLQYKHMEMSCFFFSTTINYSQKCIKLSLCYNTKKNAWQKF